MDGARFDRLTRSLASRRGLLGGITGALAAALGPLALERPATAAKCKALGKRCTRQLECCSRTCSRADGPDGRPQGRTRCLCRETLELPCGGRCCTRQQTCKKGRCVHHCKDGRISGDESDRDCGGDDCKKCALFQLCDRPSDCTTGHCAPTAAFGPKKVCVECLGDGDCRDATKPRCFTADGGPGSGGICVRCTEDDHCFDEAPFCGSGDCVQCRHEQDCQAGERCEGGSCRCTTGTDVNCGGSCPNRCASGQQCEVGSDCLSGSCVDSCVGCGDGSQCA
jgi:hypothetical protein